MLSEAVNQRHRQEVHDAYAAVNRLRLAAKVSAAIGAIAFVWTVISIATDNMQLTEGIVVLAGTALSTVVPAASLYAASFRTSLGAARLERALNSV
ncbi:MAG: hypothetical protein ACR2N9_11830 [Acidimicrobiia bacterium]